MISPMPKTATIRPDLVAVLEEFDLEANRAGFVGLKIFPNVDVTLQSSNIGRITIASLLKKAVTQRAPGAGYNQTLFEFEDWSYATKEHGQVIPIDERIRNIYLNSFDAEVHGAKMVRSIVMQAHEDRIVALASDTATYTDAAAVFNWETKASADPVADVIAAVKRVRNQSGMLANAVVLDWETYVNAKEADSVIDRLKHSGVDDPKRVNAQALAALFEVEQVIVSGGQKNTANANVSGTGLSLKPCWPRNVVGVGRVATTANVQEPCVGRTFHWSGDGSALGGILETWWDEDIRGTKIRSRMETDEKVIHDKAWTLITGTASAA